MARTTARTVRRRLAAIALAVTPLVAASAFAQAPAAAPYAMTAVDTAHGDREFLLLWPDGAPGALGSEAVDKPKITLYRAPADRRPAPPSSCAPAAATGWWRPTTRASRSPSG